MQKNLRYFLIPVTLIFAILALNVFTAKTAVKENHAAFPNFSTIDVNGRSATNEIFAGKFTILVLWVTKDTQSRQLLQTLSDWQRENQDKLQVIGLVGDVKSTDTAEKISLARQIMADCQAPQLLVNDDMTAFLSGIKTAPTICFVNPYGQLVGQPVSGYEIDLIKKEVRRLMTADSPANIDKSLIMKKLAQ
ncbi:hypothetical protein [Selenomonas sp. AE3005]|uniref:TlpA family protein disulfide reductase n=1 Tax=Selenomonas sp. AE3005 TaxID=1485543 RepID=UPI0025F002C3|nr:hypothetical protein [Selenomonas sp. AE3005]